MDNLGLVFETTNPFVNTGTPRPGQVYFRKKVLEYKVCVLSYDEYNDKVAYKIIEMDTKSKRVKLDDPVSDEVYTILYKDKVLYCPKHHFLRAFCFSH